MDRIDRAAGFATCAMLTTAGTRLIGAGVSSLWAKGAGVVPLTFGSLSLLAAGYLCDGAEVDGPSGGSGIDGCSEITGGWGSLWRTNEDTAANRPGGGVQIIRLGEVLTREWWWNGTWSVRISATYNESDDPNNPQPLILIDQIGPTDEDRERSKTMTYSLKVIEGQCAGTSDPDVAPDPVVENVTYNDVETGCTLEIKHLGFAEESEGGAQSPVWQIEQAQPETREDTGGGRIVGDCNFAPIIYYDGGGGGGGGGGGIRIPVPDPVPPTGPDGKQWWEPLVRGAISGLVAGAVEEALEQALNPSYPAGSREIYAACENKEDGSPETFSVNWPEQSFQDRVLQALDSVVDFQQQFHLWKDPVCGNEPSPVTGDPVTTNWESDERSPISDHKIVKRFVYFDQSGKSTLEHLQHWIDFTWTSGPVAVFAKGTALGKPQVWASSADEGKRVINHAAAITGADMSKVEWIITSSKSSRIGLSGTMRVMRDRHGVSGVTKRDGPSGLPDGYRVS